MTYQDDLTEAADFAMQGNVTKEQFLDAAQTAWDHLVKDAEESEARTHPNTGD